MNKKLLTAAPPPHTGWVLGEVHKITKRRKDIWYKIKLSCSVLIKKISSLLSVDYYKSNSENQFKDIQLQLHAAKVTNPYTFSIQGNKSFSGVCVEELPATETYLYEKHVSDDDEYTYIYENIKISIPPNCRVLKVAAKVYLNVDPNDNGYAYSTITNTGNNINWVDIQDQSGGSDYASIDIVKYIGVTPNKTYALSLDLYANADYEILYQDIFCKISYSSDINSHSVDIKDY